MTLGMFSEGSFWSYIVVQRNHRLIPAPLLPEFILNQKQGETSSQITAGDIQVLIENFIKRLTPGFKKTVGIVTRTEGPSQPAFIGGPPAQAQRDFNELERTLSASYNVRRIELGKEGIPTGIDVLIIGKTGKLDPRAWFAVDQFLMLGGSVVALASRFEAENSERGWQAKPLDDGLLDLLKTYGVTIRSELALDQQNFDFPFQLKRNEAHIRSGELRKSTTRISLDFPQAVSRRQSCV